MLMLTQSRKQDRTAGNLGNLAIRAAWRHMASLMAENFLDRECRRLTGRAIELALDGDIQALKMCLERILPPVRERPCSFKSPPISTAAEAATCMARVLEGVVSGEILPSKGAAHAPRAARAAGQSHRRSAHRGGASGPGRVLEKFTVQARLHHSW